MNIMDMIAPQMSAIEPEVFQREQIANISAALLRELPPPCLLRAPTGAGKTFIIAHVLQQVSQQSPTIWFWFVPYVNLIQQTEDTIAANASALTPVSLMRGRNQHPASGMVILSTAAAVARSKSRGAQYTDGQDDATRSLDQMVGLARSQGLKIGLIVDEAHIGLDTQTEFGQFAKWLSADRVLMASATPKDKRLSDFLGAAGFSAYEAFITSRMSVVDARLNKRYIEAVIYSVRQSVQTIADLQQTVLRQAWRRNLRITRLIQEAGMNFKPLLLVQVGSGATSIEEARKGLIAHCGVHPGAIGEHSADDPDPVLMASIANDLTKDVLIFKQSAGTGFDAPRAFVMASTKPVNDPDFATQFIGRIMRVHRMVRSTFPRGQTIPPELDTAYVYLANSEAQQGFEQAVTATAAMRDELQGITERLMTRETVGGGVFITNRTDKERPLFYDAPLPTSRTEVGKDGATGSELSATPFAGVQAKPLPSTSTQGTGPSLWAPEDEPALSLDQPLPVQAKPKERVLPKTREELVDQLNEVEIRSYKRRSDLAKTPKAFRAEDRPVMQDMAAASRSAAVRVEIPENLRKQALSLALGKALEEEVHTELTQGVVTRTSVAILVDRSALAREARICLAGLPQVEDEDAAAIIEVLCGRMQPDVQAEFAHLPDDERPIAQEIKKLARDCAFVIIRKLKDQLAELLHEEIAAQARVMDAGPLPDFMIFPVDLPLESSTKNLFGVMPPSKEDISRLDEVLAIDTRALLQTRSVHLGGQEILIAEFDGGHAMGVEEREFARALDQAPFVTWWHRNPDRKPYSARLVRGEHRNYFYPDFVVCLEHFQGDEPSARMIETKESTKDVSRKAKHASKLYGKVLFLTKYNSGLRIVNDDGSLGAGVDLDDLSGVQDWLRQHKPATSDVIIA